MPKGIDKLIINSPYEKPTQHWDYNRDSQTFELRSGRRKAGYIIANPESQSFDDPGMFRELTLVNSIRPRVDKWREDNYPGTTGITRKLLEHWFDRSQRQYSFFYCQLEAIETLIWLIESPASERTGIEIPKDGGDFIRLCSKMGTGSGKTILLAMILAWNILNKITYRQDTRFSANALMVAPSITVKNRLGVLVPDSSGNYYDEFSIVPDALREILRQGRIKIINWHLLLPLDDDTLKKSVVKKGPESDFAFVNRVLGDMANRKNIIVLNDEAHHAWRFRPGLKISKQEFQERNEEDEITRWVEGLDRIHKVIGIQYCFDVSATPFSPTGKKSEEEGLFGWIVSDFGLNDAIESGLVKTPRVAIRDDGQLTKELKSKFYHLYPHIRDDLQRSEETVPLPQLVVTAYTILGNDWLEKKREWEKVGRPVPPVMLTVANLVDTAKRIEYSFKTKKMMIEELCDQEKLIRVDSRAIEEAEAYLESGEISSVETSNNNSDEDTPKLSRKEQSLLLRAKVDSVGQPGKQGANIQNVISVAMISEGWDARNVTHIMGLRAFSSQLLCEQVVGRGLRRMSYDVNKDGLLDPEYVNIFGIPFTFLPHEGGDEVVEKNEKSRTYIDVVKGREYFQIKFPNIDRVDIVLKPELTLDFINIKTLELNTADTPTFAKLAPMINGKPDYDSITTIDLKNLLEKNRYQTIAFKVALDLVDKFHSKWPGNKEEKIISLLRLVEKFVKSDKIVFNDYIPSDELRKRLLITLNLARIVDHLAMNISSINKESIDLVFNTTRPILSTSDMRPWWSARACMRTQKSQISHVVADSSWEASVADRFENNKHVRAYVKNDHIGLHIYYFYEGKTHRYFPDYIAKLENEINLIIEVKGEANNQVDVKNEFIEQWISAVNQNGGFGKWAYGIIYHPEHVDILINKYSSNKNGV